MYHVYIVECNDDTFYTGTTWSLRKRLAKHNSGKGALYTKSRLPVKLVYFETFRNKHDAALREKVIKDMSQKKKRLLIEKFASGDREVYFERSEKRV